MCNPRPVQWGKGKKKLLKKDPPGQERRPSKRASARGGKNKVSSVKISERQEERDKNRALHGGRRSKFKGKGKKYRQCFFVAPGKKEKGEERLKSCEI